MGQEQHQENARGSNPKDVILYQYLAAALNQLANADDAWTQLRDVIYIH